MSLMFLNANPKQELPEYVQAVVEKAQQRLGTTDLAAPSSLRNRAICCLNSCAPMVFGIFSSRSIYIRRPCCCFRRWRGNWMTETQRKILECIDRFHKRRGYMPTIREIGKRVHIRSTSNVKYHLDQLERDGYIERDRGIARGIRRLHPEAAT